jgi:hypothetical protein
MIILKGWRKDCRQTYCSGYQKTGGGGTGRNTNEYKKHIKSIKKDEGLEYKDEIIEDGQYTKG